MADQITEERLDNLRDALMDARQRIGELETLTDSLSKRVIQIERAALPSGAAGSEKT